MCIALDTILADQQTHDARDRFADVFQRLLDARALADNKSDLPCDYDKQIAGQLGELADTHAHCLHSLPRHDTYSRHIIGTDDNWIGLICRWEPNITSSIHGHPSFAYYQVLDGSIVMELFEPVSAAEARQVSTSQMGRGDYMFSATSEGKFDNLVHRVRTESTSVFTLHLYSDNPAKGCVYRPV